MTHWRMTIEKDHLGAYDLVAADGKLRDYTLEIATVSSKLLKTRETPKGKRKCVITFVGARKAMVANTTNCEIIENMYGPQIEGWVGKRITLYQGQVRSPKGKGTIAGICVRPRPPTGAAETIAERPVDEAMREEQSAAFAREPGED